MAEARRRGGAARKEAPREREGLRERKKRQTRQYISDVATGLFIERGFDAVTVAEVADAANVSVNTVYNYFPAKEDLFLDRLSETTDLLSRWVRGRRPGESAAEAVLREIRSEVEVVSPRVGLLPGYEKFMQVMHNAPTLKARMWSFGQAVAEDLERTLREETGAAPDDPVPELVAGQIHWTYQVVMGVIGRRMVKGGTPQQVSREVLGLLDELEGILGERVLNYAVRRKEQ